MGRNAAELRAAAIATGWYDGPHLVYVGDGFSVPWEVALPISLPVGSTMGVYKSYLDRRWPHAARLHDWLYTPYGKLINATRLEADEAIYEDIAEDSVFDANIVYAAVRAGGAPYFGTSQTGVAGYPVTPTGPNIALPPFPTRPGGPGGPLTPQETYRPYPIFGGSRMAIKCIIVFSQPSEPGSAVPELNYAPAERVGGWTEGLLFDGSLSEMIEKLKGPRADGFPALLPARAAILSSRAGILGVRVYASGSGRGQFLGLGYSGSGGASDIPSMALLMSASSTLTPTVRRWTIRGIPDGQVTKGEFAPTPVFQTNMVNYIRSLSNFAFKGSVAVTSYPVFQISAGGLVTLTGVNPFVVGNLVTFRSVMVAGVRKGGQYMISAVGPLSNQFTISGWPAVSGEGGSASVPTSGNFNLSSSFGVISVQRVTTRKVGRPFGGYRGRKSKRRT